MPDTPEPYLPPGYSADDLRPEDIAPEGGPDDCDGGGDVDA